MIENKKRKKIIHFNIVEEKKFKNAKKLKPNKFINDVSLLIENTSPNNHKREKRISIKSTKFEDLLKYVEKKYLLTDNRNEFIIPKKLRSTNKLTKIKFCDFVKKNPKKKEQTRKTVNDSHLKIGQKNITEKRKNKSYNHLKSCKTINKNVSNRNNNNLKKSRTFNNIEKQRDINNIKSKEKKFKKRKKETKEYKTINEDTRDKIDTQNIIENVKHRFLCCLN